MSLMRQLVASQCWPMRGLSQAPSTSLLELGMMLKAVLFDVGPMRADLQLDGVVLV